MKYPCCVKQRSPVDKVSATPMTERNCYKVATYGISENGAGLRRVCDLHYEGWQKLSVIKNFTLIVLETYGPEPAEIEEAIASIKATLQKG